MDIQHPAAKMLVEVAKTQDKKQVTELQVQLSLLVTTQPR